MNQNGNGNVPILGKEKPKASIQVIGALIHHLDADGVYEPDAVVAGPGGQMVAVPGRHNFVTATDLIEMIRAVVREELDRPK